MKILMVNSSDIQGGAARAAYRLHKSLQSIGVESWMLVQSKVSDDYTVIGPTTKTQKIISKIRTKLDKIPVSLYKNRDSRTFSSAVVPCSDMISKINKSDADIVHLHWIAAGMLRIEDLLRIKKPIVWSLHDMWAFTGGCHYDGGCGKYTNKCRACPVLGSARNKDLSHWIFKRKEKRWSRIPNLTIIGLSRWLAVCAAKSSLFQDRKVVNLPNPIDTEAYRPLPKDQAKQILGLSKKRHILFGAMNAIGDKRKGFLEIVQALKHLNAENIELALFGSSKPENAPEFPFQARYLSRLQDDISLRFLYSSADVMVVPSLQENLSNVIMESLACGTPVVCFNIGGNSDMIDHQVNGYLANPFEPEDLARGIDWVLNHPDSNTLVHEARKKVLKEFDSIIVANKYLDLYTKLRDKRI